MKKTLTGYLLAIFTIIAWSMNIIYAKYLAGIMTPAEVSFYRWVFALLFMIPVSARSLRKNAARLAKLWKLVILMACTGIGLQNWLIYCAGYTASATNMALISILGPVFLVMLARKRTNLWQIAGISAAIIGVAVIILKGNLANIVTFRFVPGDLYMLASAFLFAVYALIQPKIPDDVPATAVLTPAIALSAVIFFFPAAPEIFSGSESSFTPTIWAILVILGIVNSGLAYLSWDLAIKKIGTVNTGTIYYTMPIFAICAAYIFLHEKIYESQMWGALLIVAGIAGIITGSNKAANTHKRHVRHKKTG